MTLSVCTTDKRKTSARTHSLSAPVPVSVPQVVSTQRQRNFAAMQRAYGNQAVLRSLNSVGVDERASGCGCGQSCAASRSLIPSHQTVDSSSAAKDVDAGGTNESNAATPIPMAGAGGAACAGGMKTINVWAENLPGAQRLIFDDVAKANTVWAACCLQINVAGGESWNTDVLDQQAPLGSLNEYSNPSSPTAEETTMLARTPPVDAIPVYYVPRMSQGSRGESFWPALGLSASRAVVVSDSAAADTFAHELGHVLLNDGSHSSDPDNLMATGGIRHLGVDKLEASQCAKV